MITPFFPEFLLEDSLSNIYLIILSSEIGKIPNWDPVRENVGIWTCNQLFFKAYMSRARSGENTQDNTWACTVTLLCLRNTVFAIGWIVSPHPQIHMLKL